MTATKSTTVAALAAAALVTSACTTPHVSEPPTTQQVSDVHERLVDLPPAERAPTVAVYRYPDRTGKHKPEDKFASYSRAVTQGASSVLVKALNDAGGGDWFEVVPRRNLQDILKERKIVRQVRSKTADTAGTVQLPALKYAGVVFEGGVIGFDGNTMTGGIGAKFLGIGGDTEYRKDTVTVYLRATSVSDGSLLHAVQARKTIFSYGVNASVYKFISYKDLLEAEAGFTNNEPNLVALRKAVEEALYAMIVEGAQQELWQFDTQQAQQRVIEQYEQRKARERRQMEQFFAADQEGAEVTDISESQDQSPDI